MTHLEKALPAGVRGYLSGLDFPAGRTELLAAARRNGAPASVIDAIARLPADGIYEGPGEHHGPQPPEMPDRAGGDGARGPAQRKMTVEEAGRKGGARTALTRGRQFYQEIGRKGGEARRGKLGPEGYRELGRKGGRASHSRAKMHSLLDVPPPAAHSGEAAAPMGGGEIAQEPVAHTPAATLDRK